NFAPKNWLPCDGRLLSIPQNTALFSILGTAYGGNGTTNFALPDLRGAVEVSPGQAPARSMYTLGQTGGAESVQMTVNELAAHTHAVTASVAINANDSRADMNSPKNAVLSQPPETSIYAQDPDGATTMNGNMVKPTVTLGSSVGSSLPVPTQMPYLAVTYCICVNGIFPSRN